MESDRGRIGTPSRVLFLALAFFAGEVAAQPADLPAFVATAKDMVTHDMRDPSSAQWRGLFISDSGTKRHFYALCGEVNAKNGYGAYAGFRRFYASPGTPEITSVEGVGANGVAVAKMWPDICKDRSLPVQ